jgi:hypothetical protein
VISSVSTAFPFPFWSGGTVDSGEGTIGDESPLFLRAISMLKLLGNETLFVPFELPLLSTCKLALVDPECLFCLCSGSVRSG